MRKRLRVVEVYWEDCAFMQAWRSPKSVKRAAKQLVSCCTIGYVIEDGPKRLILAATFGKYDPQTMVSNCTIIPRTQIVSVRDVERGLMRPERTHGIVEPARLQTRDK